MFKRLKLLFMQGRISSSDLDCAVDKGWITKDEAETIRSTDPEDTPVEE